MKRQPAVQFPPETGSLVWLLEQVSESFYKFRVYCWLEGDCFTNDWVAQEAPTHAVIVNQCRNTLQPWKVVEDEGDEEEEVS